VPKSKWSFSMMRSSSRIKRRNGACFPSRGRLPRDHDGRRGGVLAIFLFSPRRALCERRPNGVSICKLAESPGEFARDGGRAQAHGLVARVLTRKVPILCGWGQPLYSTGLYSFFPFHRARLFAAFEIGRQHEASPVKMVPSSWRYRRCRPLFVFHSPITPANDDSIG